MSQRDQYEWNERKRESNLCKHEVDFVEVEKFQWDEALTTRDNRFNYGEQRFVSIGPVGNRLFVVTWTPRDGVVRIISLRKANRREVNYYERNMD